MLARAQKRQMIPVLHALCPSQTHIICSSPEYLAAGQLRSQGCAPQIMPKVLSDRSTGR